jgi:hypothetical protein
MSIVGYIGIIVGALGFVLTTLSSKFKESSISKLKRVGTYLMIAGLILILSTHEFWVRLHHLKW